jgi:hypothetical protein
MILRSGLLISPADRATGPGTRPPVIPQPARRSVPGLAESGRITVGGGYRLPKCRPLPEGGRVRLGGAYRLRA